MARLLRWRGLQKLAVVIGGFMVLAGIVLLGIAVLATSGFYDVGLLLERKFLLPFALLMVAVGFIDTLAAIVLTRW